MVKNFFSETNLLSSNPRFDIDITYLRFIILSVIDDVPIDIARHFLTDFMNYKIKSVQSFKCVYRNKVVEWA
jgi:hypothetical protein